MVWLDHNYDKLIPESQYQKLTNEDMSLLKRVGFRELRRDRRIAKPLHEDPALDLIRRIKVVQKY